VFTCRRRKADLGVSPATEINSKWIKKVN
jgi:hypothetical protein